MLEQYFSKYRKGIIGIDSNIQTPIHDSIPLIYADWTASGRMYGPIEDRIRHDFLPFVANTHTDTNYTGSKMTFAYHKAQSVIKDHVGANEHDVLIASDSGMTGVVNKLQRILGLKVHESFRDQINLDEKERPVVFVTHMEHHSNQTSWLETIAEVVVVPPNEQGLLCPEKFTATIAPYLDRKMKIAAITSCSNVTGIMTNYMEIAELMHKHDGLCFVDFACSAPYVEINMHEDDASGRYLDAVYFSPHKFLGGPGTSGILVFNEKLYANTVPDHPGGGTVTWTNPWGVHRYFESIEAREDGGTPAFLQTIKAAMCMRLKEEIGTENIQKREEEILSAIWKRLESIPNLHVLAGDHKHRMGVISFYIDGLHYNLGVKMLNDHFGIQTRGGCSCAGTYGHFLFDLDESNSDSILEDIEKGNCASKPGWIRLSIHPTHTDAEIQYMMDALEELAKRFSEWQEAYHIDYASGVIQAKDRRLDQIIQDRVNESFSAALS